MLITMFAAGCASFPGKELPTYSQEQLVKPANKVTATYDVKAVALGRENKGGAEILDKAIQKTLAVGPVFSQVTAGGGTGDYHLSFAFRNEGNAVLAFVSGFISGFTFTVLPAYAKDEYVLDVEVKQGDRMLKAYSYHDHMDTWLQALLIFIAPSHWPQDVAASVIENMLMNFTHDFAEDMQSGVLVAQQK